HARLYLHSFPTRRSSDLADVQEREPDVRGRVVAAEKLRQERRSGHRRVHPDLHVSRRTPRAVTGPESGSRPTGAPLAAPDTAQGDRKSTRLNSSHVKISY